MRLVKIKPNYFRSFGDSEWINLDADLVVLHGPNGYGKTSIAEATEWLLYGKTKRRQKGEELNKRDYQGSYRNAHAPRGSITFVEAIIRLSSGVEHSIKRELVIGHRKVEFSNMFIDNNPGDLSSIGISGDEIYDPIIAQDSLKDFIHSKPKDRRDKISAAFGLEPLIRFKTIVDSARDRLQKNPPQQILEAKQALRSIVNDMSNSSFVSDIESRWASEDINLDNDQTEFQSIVLRYLGIDIWEKQTVTRELKNKKDEVSRRVFDITPIQVPEDIIEVLNELGNYKKRNKEIIDTLDTALVEFEMTKSIYTQKLLQFWQTGLDLIDPRSPDKCPMCEADTLTQKKRNEFQSRIKQSSGYSEAINKLVKECSNLQQFINDLTELIKKLFPKFLDEGQCQKLTDLFKGDLQPCSSFLTVHDATGIFISQINKLLTQHKKQLDDIPDKAKDAEKIEEVKQFVVSLKDILMTAISDIKTYVNNYTNSLNIFKPKLEERIAEESIVKEINGLIKPLEGWHNVEIVEQYKKLLDESLKIVRQIEAQIKLKQDTLFAAKGQEIYSWYEMMNPGADVQYSRMEPGTDSITLWAKTFGVEVNAVACLSESQLNCLGLSINFTRTLTPGSPFYFLLMDDPVQSMDDDHCQALVIDVIRNLLDKGKQLIVFSHVQGLVDEIWDTYYERQPIRLRISDFQKDGPIVEDAETLQQALNRAVHLAKGNEDNRRLAIKVIRRCVELLIRDVCRDTKSTPPPYSATARNMIPNFQMCQGTKPNQTQGLSTTINFSDPSTHTEKGWAVPTQPQIIPHVDRLRQIAKELNLS